MIRWVNLYDKPYPKDFKVPAGFVVQNGLSRSWKLPPDVTFPANMDFDLSQDEEADRFWSASDRNLPELPQKLSPSQAARLSEILDFLHRGLTSATENLRPAGEGPEVLIPFADWQKIQAVQMLLARYLRAVAEPDALVE